MAGCGGDELGIRIHFGQRNVGVQFFKFSSRIHSKNDQISGRIDGTSDE